MAVRAANTAPYLKITNAISGMLVSNENFTVMGVATDDVQFVTYSLNGPATNEVNTSNGWTNWNQPLTLMAGTNIFSAYATATNGNISTDTVNIVMISTNPLTLQTVNKGTISPNYSNAWLDVGRNYSMTASPASGFIFSNWTGGVGSPTTYYTNKPTVTFMMETGLVMQAIFLDTLKPYLKITNPISAVAFVTNANFYTVTGVATDDEYVASVEYSFNGAAYTTAPYSFAVLDQHSVSWSSLPLTLTAGTNMFSVYAQATNGNFSVTDTVDIVMISSNPLTLQAMGRGTISPNYSNAWLDVGRNYSMTATPASGFIFTNWLGGTNYPLSVLTNKPTVTFMMETGLVMQANFKDTLKPYLKITNPVSLVAFTTNLNSYHVMGVATDDQEMASVNYSLNGPGQLPVTTTNGWTNWNQTLTLMAGTNVFSAYATATNGNISTDTVDIVDISSNQLMVQAMGRGTISPNYSNAWLDVGRNYSMTATPASGFIFTNWLGGTNYPLSVLTNKPTVTFMMETGLVMQADFKDMLKPFLKITNPISSVAFTTNLNSYQVVGVATDDQEMASVNYSLNGPGQLPVTTTNGWTNWNQTLTLMAGTNVFSAYATATNGNISTDTVDIVEISSNQLTVQTSGKGTISPNYSNQWLDVGRNYSMTASAGSGFVFTNWTGGITNMSFTLYTNKPTVTFMMETGLVMQANFRDALAPYLKITNPITSLILMTNQAEFSPIMGVATDDEAVASVNFSFNGSAFTAATNNGIQWGSPALSLTAGTNVFSVYALATNGNYSTTDTVNIVNISTNVTFTNFPAVVSNTYSGVITLQINGLIDGITNVLVQKYLDANTNGIIDSGDLLVQQFPLSVGVARVFTNQNTLITLNGILPGDTSSTPGQITSPLNFQNGDFAQNIAAGYLYKISSPLGQFRPITNSFAVTNFLYSSAVTGAVQNASLAVTTNIPYALVLLCVPGQLDGSVNMQAGAVANNVGDYSISAPPGTYFLAVAKSNFVNDLSAPAADITLVSNQINTNNISLLPATMSITGRVVDAATGIGLPGLSGTAVSSNQDLLSFYFTDPNGKFFAPVIGTNEWETPVDLFAAAFQGYLMPLTNQFFNVTNKVVSVTNALSRATDIFYGVVSNTSAAPVPVVNLYANNNSNQAYGVTGQNGQYSVLAGTNQWNLAILATNNPGLTNPYVFSPGYVQTNFTAAGLAIEQNFTLAFAPYTISGTVEDVNGNPIAGVQVFAISTGSPAFEAFNAYTTANGSYTLNVTPFTTWTVGINSNSLANSFTNLCADNLPTNQTVVVSGNSVSGINFSILGADQLAILTTNLANATAGSYYDTNLEAESCENVTNWTIAHGITLSSLFQSATNAPIAPGTPIFSNGKLLGFIQSYFSFGLVKTGNTWTPYATNCTVDNNNGSANQTAYFNGISANVTVSAPIPGTNSIPVLFNGGGLTWTISPTTQGSPPFSATVSLSQAKITLNGQNPLAYNVYSNSLITTTSGAGSNTVGFLLGALPPFPAGTSLNVASTIPYTGTNNTVVWIQNHATTNQYLISAYGPQTNSLPDGIILYPDGTLAGTPVNVSTNETFYFTVAAQDAASHVAVQPLSLFVFGNTNSVATNSSVQIAGLLLSSNVFSMQINGVQPGQTYTVLMSTNLLSTNWVSIFSTNAASTNALLIPDANATNKTRFYRVMITP